MDGGIRMGLWLRLHPYEHERSFWNAQPTLRRLRIVDLCALSLCLVKLALWLFRWFRLEETPATPGIELPRAVLFFFFFSFQIWLVARAPDFYQRHRRPIAWFNRCFRLAVAARRHTRQGTEDVVHAMLLRSIEDACIKGRTPCSLALLRVQLHDPWIAFQGVFSLLLPVRDLLWLQSAVAILCFTSSASIMVCATRRCPGLTAAAPKTCCPVQQAAHGIAAFLPPFTSKLYPELCEGLSGLWLLQEFYNTCAAIFIPIVGVYVMEYRLKACFLKTQGIARFRRPWDTVPLLLVALGIICLISAVWSGLEILAPIWVPTLKCYPGQQ